MSKRGHKGGRTLPQPWTEFTERVVSPEMQAGGFRIFRNNRYQVTVRGIAYEGALPFGIPGGRVLHLSIKRLDRGPIRDWRHVQRIKNEIVGPECEGVELYPAESRLVDEANQYHLWVVPEPGWRFPFGFHERLVGDDLDPAPGAEGLPPTSPGLVPDRARQRRLDR